MISFEEMKERIQSIDKQYTLSDSLNAQMLAKLAVLEIGGWIEDFFDYKVKEYAEKSNPECVDEMNVILKRFHAFGFEKYYNHLINLIGQPHAYKLISEMEREKSILESSLSIIKRQRDNAAHTSIALDSSIAAPNYLLGEFEKVYKYSCLIFENVGKIIDSY